MDPKQMACVSFLSRTFASRPAFRCLRQFSVSAHGLNNRDTPAFPGAQDPTAPLRSSGRMQDLLGTANSRFSRPSAARGSPITPPLGLADSRLPRMGPTAGRSVIVTSDPAQAFMKLRTILWINKVMQDHRAQKFHERPSAKRKRLKSLRYRRRFKEGFKKMVALAMDMKNKGM